MSIRTLRLSLRPAASLLAASFGEDFQMPDQNALDVFLLNAPRQKAAITGFISYLNRQQSMNLVARIDGRHIREKRRATLERKLIKLLENGVHDEHFKIKLFSIALPYLHGLSRSVGRRIRDNDVSSKDDEGFSIRWQGDIYWIPHWNAHRRREES